MKLYSILTLLTVCAVSSVYAHVDALVVARSAQVVACGSCTNCHHHTPQPVARPVVCKESELDRAERLYCAGKYEQANQMYGRALADTKGYTQEQLTRAWICYGESLLAVGRFTEGLKAREERLKLPTYAALKKVWDGITVVGKRILVRRDPSCGIGDIAFFGRYLHILKKLGAKEIICEGSFPERAALLLLMGADRVVAPGACKDAEYDADVYIMSLPYYLNCNGLGITQPGTIPVESWLQLNGQFKDKVEAWKTKLTKDKSLSVFVCWRASKLPGGVIRRYERDVALTELAPAIAVPGVKIYGANGPDHFAMSQQEYNERKAAGTLNKGMLALDEKDILPEGYTIEAMNPDDGGAFVNMLAMFEAMRQVKRSLVISVDTAVLNIAGAMGVPTIGLTPKERDWRWGTNPRKTDWFPHILVMMQDEQGVWKPCMNYLNLIMKRVTKGIGAA